MTGLLLSLSMFSRLIQVIVCVCKLFFNGQIIFHYMHIPHFAYHSLADGHLDPFCLLTIRNNAAINIHMHIVYSCVFISLGHILRRQIAGSDGNSRFKF